MIFRNRCHGPLRQRQFALAARREVPPSLLRSEGRRLFDGPAAGRDMAGGLARPAAGVETQREAFQMAMNSSALRRSSEAAGQPMSFCSSWGRAFIRRAALLERWAL